MIVRGKSTIFRATEILKNYSYHTIIVSRIFQRKKQVNRTELLSFFFLVNLCKSKLICTKSNCTCVTNKSFLPKALTIQWNYIVDNQPNMSKPIDPAHELHYCFPISIINIIIHHRQGHPTWLPVARYS